MKKVHKVLALALALLILASTAACGARSGGDSTSAADTAQYPAAGENADVNYSEAQAELDEYGGIVASASQGDIAALPEKMIYSGSAEIETLEFDETIEKLNKLIEEYGGFIQSSSITGNDYYSSAYGTSTRRSAYYEIRVPSGKFSAVTGLLETLGNVPYLSTNAENVSTQYQDAEARLKTYRAQEERYLELLDMAETVEDVLHIESYLSSVRYDIERLESQVKSWDAQISYSTLSLSVTEVAVYTEKKDDPYGQQLSDAFNNTLKSTGRFFKGLFKFLVGALPVLVVLAVIAVPVLLIVRARRRKKKASGESRPD